MEKVVFSLLDLKSGTIDLALLIRESHSIYMFNARLKNDLFNCAFLLITVVVIICLKMKSLVLIIC